MPKKKEEKKIDLKLPKKEPSLFEKYMWLQNQRREGNLMGGVGFNTPKGGAGFYGMVPMSNNKEWKGTTGIEGTFPINDQLRLKLGLENEIANTFNPFFKAGLRYNFQHGGEINRYDNGGEVKPYVAKDQADFDYRNQMYNDSLNLYDYGQKWQTEWGYDAEDEKFLRSDYNHIKRKADAGGRLLPSESMFLLETDLSTLTPEEFKSETRKWNASIGATNNQKGTTDIGHYNYNELDSYMKDRIYNKDIEATYSFLPAHLSFIDRRLRPGYDKPTQKVLPPEDVSLMPGTTPRRPFPTRKLITKEDGTVDWLAEEEGGHLTKPVLRPYQENGKTMLRFEKDPTTPGYVPGPINFESGGITYDHYPKMDPIDVPVFNRENKIWEQPPSLNPMDVEDYDLDIDTIVAIQEGTASDEYVRPNVSGVRSNRHWATVNFPGEAPRGMTKDEYTSYFKNKSKLDKRTAANNQFKMGGQLPQYGNGDEIKPYVAKDAADFAYRQQMYNDSLELYNSNQALYEILNSNLGPPDESLFGGVNEDLRFSDTPNPEKGTLPTIREVGIIPHMFTKAERIDNIYNPFSEPEFGYTDVELPFTTPNPTYDTNSVIDPIAIANWNFLERYYSNDPDYITNNSFSERSAPLSELKDDGSAKYILEKDEYNLRGEDYEYHWSNYGDTAAVPLYKKPTQKVWKPSEGFPNTTNGEFTRELTSMNPNIPQDARNTGSLEGAIGLLRLGRHDINPVPGIVKDLKDKYQNSNAIWAPPSPDKSSLSKIEEKDVDLNFDKINLQYAVEDGTAQDEYVRPNSVAAYERYTGGNNFASMNLPGQAPRGISYEEYKNYFLKKGKYAEDTRITDSFKYGGALNRYGNGGEIGDLPLTPPSPAPIDNTYTNITTPNYTSEEMAQMISAQQDLEDKALLEEIEMQKDTLSSMWENIIFGGQKDDTLGIDLILEKELKELENNTDINWADDYYDWEADYYANTFKLEDPRVIRATTGDTINPNVDLMGGNYNSEVVQDIIQKANQIGVDPWTALAVGLQETLLGKNDINLGHVEAPTAADSGLEKFDPYGYINVLKDKLAWANKDSVDNEALALQYYNGTGSLFPNTEEDYHGFQMQKAYGVPIPKEGLDMQKNPLYGKQIIDLRENVLKQNEYIRQLIEEAQ